MNEACKNCNNTGLHCDNPDSPCYGWNCGEYPGTGKDYKKDGMKDAN